MIGEPGTPLAEEGLEQARLTGQDLSKENVTVIACSPFIRTQQTAEIVAGELGIPLKNIIVIDELHERRMGSLEGKFKQHETSFFYENDTAFGFEPRNDLINRMRTALGRIRSIAEKSKGTVAVVGHATSGFYLLQIAKGKTRFEDFEPVNQMDNAEFTEIELS